MSSTKNAKLCHLLCTFTHVYTPTPIHYLTWYTIEEERLHFSWYTRRSFLVLGGETCRSNIGTRVPPRKQHRSQTHGFGGISFRRCYVEGIPETSPVQKHGGQRSKHRAPEKSLAVPSLCVVSIPSMSTRLSRGRSLGSQAMSLSRAGRVFHSPSASRRFATMVGKKTPILNH